MSRFEYERPCISVDRSNVSLLLLLFVEMVYLCVGSADGVKCALGKDGSPARVPRRGLLYCIRPYLNIYIVCECC